jgi:3-phenylpropionate/trans-cinnamate dioxygenase ferredoxin subunit
MAWIRLRVLAIYQRILMYNYIDVPEEQCEYYKVCALGELPAGERIFIEIEKNPIVLINIAGKIFAIGDVCSHDYGPVGDGELEGETIKCPRHGAIFDLNTGKAIRLPAVEDIPAYPIRVCAGNLEIGIPKK